MKRLRAITEKENSKKLVKYLPEELIGLEFKDNETPIIVNVSGHYYVHLFILEEVLEK